MRRRIFCNLSLRNLPLLMNEDLLTFHRSHEPEITGDMARKLENAGIYVQLENDDKLFDPTFAQNPLQKETRIKLRPADFEKANEILADYYDEYAKDIDRDYYLFSFSNRELTEILAKPDEWGKLDYQLAQKILAERGETFDKNELDYLKDKRIEVLSKPDKSPVVLILLGYCFIVAGLFSLGCLFASLVIGFVLTGFKKTLPNGQTAFTYMKNDRNHGKVIIALSVMVLAVTLFYPFFSRLFK